MTQYQTLLSMGKAAFEQQQRLACKREGDRLAAAQFDRLTGMLTAYALMADKLLCVPADEYLRAVKGGKTPEPDYSGSVYSMEQAGLE